MIKNLKERLSKLREWVKRWPETWAEPLGILLFVLTIPLFNWLLSASKAPEIITLQNILIVGIQLAAINALIFIGILLNFRAVYDWYKKKILVSDWMKLSPWQRWITFIVFYLVLFLAAALLFASLQ